MTKLLAVILLGWTGVSAAQEWPTKPLRIIVTFDPGGVTDNAARVIAGTAAAAQAEPDGHTLLLGYDGTLVINPHVYGAVPFDTLRDFSAVSKLGDATLLLVAHPGAGVKNLGELLKQRTGARLEHVPYKGGGQAIIDVVGGQIPLVFTAIATACRADAVLGIEPVGNTPAEFTEQVRVDLACWAGVVKAANVRVDWIPNSVPGIPGT